MRIRRALSSGIVMAALLAAGCGKSPDRPPDQSIEAAPTEPSEPAPAPVPHPPAAKPAPEPVAVAPRVKPAPEPTADQQVIDDAEATGMTAHVDPDQDQAPAADANRQQ